MENTPLRESLWRCGWRDTKVVWTSWIFLVLDGVVGVIIGGIWGWFWGLAIVVFAMFCVWIGATARAPIKQRNEARQLVEQQRKPSESEVTDAIRLLEAEALVLKREEEERSYSFAQVFLAIADQLSIGVSPIQFEAKIRKGLHIDDYGGWYFPHKDEGIAHLIGVLDQNALVERRNEEYQRIVRDYPADINEITLDTINTVKPGSIFRPKPPKHLEKGTEVKYYLSPLGSRVIQQFRQQSTAHKEGSQTE